MAESPKPRWIIQGTGHWIMAASAWLLAFFAGFQIAAHRDDKGLLIELTAIPFSLFIWLLSLRAKRTKN